MQHSEGYSTGTWDVGGNAFYWQDHMGDLEYVRQACRLARKYGPEDIKLFINDYNLESDWDNNKKVKSIVGWIKKWEADGVTKIDGIGTQMHISCFEDASIQKNIQNASRASASATSIRRIRLFLFILYAPLPGCSSLQTVTSNAPSATEISAVLTRK